MTTREELIEALRALHTYNVPGSDHEWILRDEAIELASRLPTTCTEAHEPTKVVVNAWAVPNKPMLEAGHKAQYGMTDAQLAAIYRAMERARVEGE